MNWSFCIITSEFSRHNLRAIVDSISTQFTENQPYEIIIVGGNELGIRSNKVRFIQFKESKFHFNKLNFLKNLKKFNIFAALFGAGWITKKKNIAVMNAKFENVCILHDYVELQPEWAKGFDVFGGEWDVCITPVLNYDGSRYRDWMVIDEPGIGPGLLPYGVHSPHMFISGAYFLVKKDFYLKNPLDESLFWGEGEDIEWSLRVRALTKFKLNTLSSVRLLKQKPTDQAPYCKEWTLNSKKLIEKYS